MAASQDTGIRETGSPVRISAHQGGSELARSATYAAYEQLAATGAEYVEFDVRRTRDQVLVVCHDGRGGRLGVTGTCHRHGVGVMVWTVDSDQQIGSFLADERVDVLITNRPRRAVELRTGLRD